MAAASRGWVKVLVQPVNDSVDAMAALAFCFPFGEYSKEQFGAAPVLFHVAGFIDARGAAGDASDRAQERAVVLGCVVRLQLRARRDKG